MGRSAGAGSPVWFRCAVERRENLGLQAMRDHVVRLTGRERPYQRKRGSVKGSRSSTVSREYECSCGHVGWSNHRDLERMADADR